MPDTPSFHIYPCGDHALTIEWEDSADLRNHQRVLALYGLLKEKNIYGIRDIIPAYSTVTVVYDTVMLLRDSPKYSVYERMCENILAAVGDLKIRERTRPKVVDIPVCYDVSLAPDLLSLAEGHRISPEEVVQLHTGKRYRVYMIGFLPGFAYMGSVDAKIVTPRRDTPRTKVPAGSVGIAGIQTGIYPFESPGGWQLIGRTPLVMFDAHRAQPCLLQPGEEVQFHAISLSEYQQMQPL